MSKKVLITGVTGQDGSYMVDFLLKKTPYNIYGAVRRVTKPNYDNIRHNFDNDRFALVEMDITDFASVIHAVRQIKPDYLINFAANSFVGNSWDMPINHFNTNAMGVLNCLEAIRLHQPFCRFYSAGSSEQWGNVDYCPQDEKHPFKPRSPYGASKCAAHYIVKVYRESYNIYAVQGLLLNHESERRGSEFVTQKIAEGVARIKERLDKFVYKFEPIELGNLDAKRDWSHAEDFVDGVWRMLNQEHFNKKRMDAFEKALEDRYIKRGEEYRLCDVWKDFVNNIKEYVFSSNETHSVREFVERAFAHAGIKGVWHGKEKEETYLLSEDGILPTKKEVVLVRINPKFYRPAEVDLLLGDSTRARKELGWEPSVSFDELVKRMVESKIK